MALESLCFLIVSAAFSCNMAPSWLLVSAFSWVHKDVGVEASAVHLLPASRSGLLPCTRHIIS